MVMPTGLDSIVDLDLYPLDRRDLWALDELFDRAHVEFSASGVVVLREFLRPEAIAEIAAAALANGRLDSFRFTDIDAGEALPDVGSGGSRVGAGQGSPSSERVLAYDRIPGGSPVKRLFQWEPLLDFVSRVVGEPVYRSADDLGALTVRIHEPGDGEDWGFGFSDYTLTLHIAAPEQGGIFEYVPLSGAFAGLGGGMPGGRVDMLPTVPGTLVLHAGRRSTHRVTQVRGKLPRVTADMAFNSKPGQRLNDLQRRKWFGRGE
ncbi:hypothetical protein AB0N05_15130 [Nocardia sp. NPDC051030]|uniref:HalD/BesD family halogenase n=1 Tax=Nocardia sp. NPDC051030 TaxID=3155162 RepID=UPI00343BA24B